MIRIQKLRKGHLLQTISLCFFFFCIFALTSIYTLQIFNRKDKDAAYANSYYPRWHVVLMKICFLEP